MTHRKEQYNAYGYEVVIQQVNEGGRISAWIDGFTAHVYKAVDCDELPDQLTADSWDDIESVLAWMVDNDYYYCNSCDSLYNAENVVRTHFAGHKCSACDAEDKHCPENPNGDSHDDECLNPSQRHNARVATKYKCKHCGRKRHTTPTG